MGRARRIHLPNAFVHVTQRCNHGEWLLLEARAKQLYLEELGRVATELGYQVLEFCIQDSHIHLVLLTPAEIVGHTVAEFMHRLNTRFGHRFNELRGWRGTCWQGRYKATGWLSVKQLLVLEILLWYVASNPARRKVKAVRAVDWPWSGIYWLARGERGPVATTLGEWLIKIYGPRGEADPAGAFVKLLEGERPDWAQRAAELDRQGLPWLGKDEAKAVRHDLAGLRERIRAEGQLNWKRQVELYSLLAQPMLRLSV